MTGNINPIDVTILVLAAGASERMGTANKLLVTRNGKPLICHVINAALESGADDIIVVTGYESKEIRNALDGINVQFVHNPDYEDGQSTSLKTGIGALREACSGVAVLLGDMPDLKGKTVKALMETFRDSGGQSICVPNYKGRRGNPVLWPKEFFPEILLLEGDQGARKLLTAFPDRIVKVDTNDLGVLKDFDTPDDFITGVS